MPIRSRDESDNDGSDVDLHFLHPLAAAYADDPYDCFWDNHTPDWGSFDEANDPRLERDDTAVTVRVYIRGALIDAWSDVALDALDRWHSFHIDWPSGIVTRIGDTGPDIRVEYRPDYVH